VVRDVGSTAMNQAEIAEARVVTHYEAYYSTGITDVLFGTFSCIQ